MKTNQIHHILTISIFFMIFSYATSLTAADLSWSVGYGQKPEQVGFLNEKVVKEFMEPSGFGPMGFRVFNSEAWIADSTRGRVLCFGPDGKIKKDLQIQGVPANTLIEDLALVHGADRKVTGIWVADGADLIIRQISAEDGKELVKFGSKGRGPGQVIQIHQLEAGPSGNLYVGDYGREKISVFDSKGNFIREHAWQNSGFALDEKENLFYISFTKDAGYSIQNHDPSGKQGNPVKIGLPKLSNPRLWAIEKDGNFLITFVPVGGYKGLIELYRVSPKGEVVGKATFANPKGISRFLDFSADGGQFQAEADFNAAPDGNFVIKQTKFELK